MCHIRRCGRLNALFYNVRRLEGRKRIVKFCDFVDHSRGVTRNVRLLFAILPKSVYYIKAGTRPSQPSAKLLMQKSRSKYGRPIINCLNRSNLKLAVCAADLGPFNFSLPRVFIYIRSPEQKHSVRNVRPINMLEIVVRNS